MPLTFSCFCASVANTSEQIIIIPPTIATTARVFPIFPFVKDKTFPALKNTPEPITMPTTIQIAVSSPYFLVNFSKILSIPLLKNYVQFIKLNCKSQHNYTKKFIIPAKNLSKHCIIALNQTIRPFYLVFRRRKINLKTFTVHFLANYLCLYPLFSMRKLFFPCTQSLSL